MDFSTLPFPRVVKSFMEQLLPGHREPEPPAGPPTPANLIAIDQATEFLRSESDARGFTYAPPTNVLLEFCRFSSPTFFGGMTKVTTRHGNIEFHYFTKEGLLALVRREFERRAAMPPAPLAPVVPYAPPRPTFAERLQMAEARRRASRTYGEIVQEQTEKWLREQAANEAETAKATAPAAQ